MTFSACSVTEWLKEHHQGMIRCPYQPGQLVISREACMKRHATASQTDYDDLMKVDPFTHKLKNGLLLCRKCPIGNRLVAVSAHQEEPAATACA